jgi:hypothetical protein
VRSSRGLFSPLAYNSTLNPGSAFGHASAGRATSRGPFLADSVAYGSGRSATVTLCTLPGPSRRKSINGAVGSGSAIDPVKVAASVGALAAAFCPVAPDFCATPCAATLTAIKPADVARPSNATLLSNPLTPRPLAVPLCLTVPSEATTLNRKFLFDLKNDKKCTPGLPCCALPSVPISVRHLRHRQSLKGRRKIPTFMSKTNGRRMELNTAELEDSQRREGERSEPDRSGSTFRLDDESARTTRASSSEPSVVCPSRLLAEALDHN